MKKFVGLLCAVVMLFSQVNVLADIREKTYTSEGGYFATNYYGETEYTAVDGTKYIYYLYDDSTVWLTFRKGVVSEVVIPETIDGLPVVYVDAWHATTTTVESIIFPNTCKKIKDFKSFKCLKSVTLPNELPEIEEQTFQDCKLLESINIPGSVTKIGKWAFMGCSSLRNVEFNEGLIKIGYGAFNNCNIQSVEFPSTLMKIETDAFYCNSELKSVTIPESVTEIELGAFEKCGLETVTLHSGIEKIGGSAFKCENLTEITGLTEEQIALFWYAYSDTPWAQTMVDEDDSYIIDKNGKLVGYVGTLTDVVIPEGVKVIGGGAFSGKKITSVKIPSTVTEIAYTAFYAQKKLTEITIPGSVTNIGAMAFSSCDNLKNITFEYADTTLVLGEACFQWADVREDTFVTNNRRYANKLSAFRNTRLDPDCVGEYDDISSVEPTEQPTAEPKQTEVPTEEPAERTTAEPSEQPILNVVSENDKITVNADGKEVDFGDELPFVDENGRTQIPIRAVAETLGCEVSWDGETQTVTLSKGDKKVIVIIGSAEMKTENGGGYETVIMDTVAKIVNDRTYIPVRYVGEALGVKVKWNGN